MLPYEPRKHRIQPVSQGHAVYVVPKLTDKGGFIGLVVAENGFVTHVVHRGTIEDYFSSAETLDSEERSAFERSFNIVSDGNTYAAIVNPDRCTVQQVAKYLLKRDGHNALLGVDFTSAEDFFAVHGNPVEGLGEALVDFQIKKSTGKLKTPSERISSASDRDADSNTPGSL